MTLSFLRHIFTISLVIISFRGCSSDLERPGIDDLPSGSRTVASDRGKRIEAGSSVSYAYEIRSSEDLDAFFAYDPDHYDVIISGHRGGNLHGYPENCLETFERFLRYAPMFYEVDPRLTKDNVIVLSHDASLERTTTGTGLIVDHTFDELQMLNLRDRWGAETDYKFRTLREIISWSKGNVILNFDKKDVPPSMMCNLLKELDAKNCIFTVHSVRDAKEFIEYLPDVRFSAFLGTMEKVRAFRDAGLLPHVVVAYLENSEVVDTEVVDALHEAGIRCMVSTAPVESGAQWDKELQTDLFRAVLATRPDIIEADYPMNLLPFHEVRKQSPLIVL